ncbi:MAG: DUF1499 domain-containing protein [Pseudomonadota bacterium]
MKRRLLVQALGVMLVAACAGGLAVRRVDHPAETWHVDPTTAARTGKPNDYLAAPAGTTVAAPDRGLQAADPAAALAALDRVAQAAPRTAVIAGSVAEGFVTYVQTSALFGFPDYISVKRVEGGLAVWSRSRYGYSDLGVNKARVTEWLAEAGL